MGLLILFMLLFMRLPLGLERLLVKKWMTNLVSVQQNPLTFSRRCVLLDCFSRKNVVIKGLRSKEQEIVYVKILPKPYKTHRKSLKIGLNLAFSR